MKVTNTGSTSGDEVVQLYLRDELSSVARPVREVPVRQITMYVHFACNDTKSGLDYPGWLI